VEFQYIIINCRELERLVAYSESREYCMLEM
jgi:hypothetical protein